MQVHFSNDLTDLIVYFNKCNHWSWCVRIYRGRMLRSVVPVNWPTWMLFGLLLLSRVWCFTWISAVLSAWKSNTVLCHLLRCFYCICYGTLSEQLLHKKQQNAGLAGFNTGK